MSITWTTEQVLALAPDPASAKAGKDLAGQRKKWANLGQDERAAWGECQGSGSKPYQTKIDLSEPAFSCSCPSRKFPCKHGLGLFLMLAQQPALFASGTPPACARCTRSAWRPGCPARRRVGTAHRASGTSRPAPAC